MNLKIIHRIATGLFVLMCASPLLASFALPNPFRWSEMIAAPAIVGEAFLNYIFNIPALIFTILLFTIGTEFKKKGRVTASLILLLMSIITSLAGIIFMIYRSTLYS